MSDGGMADEEAIGGTVKSREQTKHYEELVVAETLYLEKSGWLRQVAQRVGEAQWVNEAFRPHPVSHGHAVNIQKQYDRIWRK